MTFLKLDRHLKVRHYFLLLLDFIPAKSPNDDLRKLAIKNSMISKACSALRKIESDKAESSHEETNKLKAKKKGESPHGQVATEVTALVSASPPELRDRFDVSINEDEEPILLSVFFWLFNLNC